MASRTEGMVAAVGMVMTVLAVSVVIPGLFVALDNPQTTAIEQAEGERNVITGDVSSQVTLITNQDEVNVSVLDRKTGETNSTGQMQIGQTRTVVLENQNINVTLVDVFSTNSAVLSYEYPLYVGWPPGAQIIVREMPDLLIISTLVGIIGAVLVFYEVFSDT